MGRRFKRVVDAFAESTSNDHNISQRIRIQQLPHRINNQHIAFWQFCTRILAAVGTPHHRSCSHGFPS